MGELIKSEIDASVNIFADRVREQLDKGLYKDHNSNNNQESQLIIDANKTIREAKLLSDKVIMLTSNEEQFCQDFLTVHELQTRMFKI